MKCPISLKVLAKRAWQRIQASLVFRRSLPRYEGLDKHGQDVWESEQAQVDAWESEQVQVIEETLEKALGVEEDEEWSGILEYSVVEHAGACAKLLGEDRGMVALRRFFEGSTGYIMNWLFLSVSGVAGSYTTLTNLMGNPEYWDKEERALITALVVQPRMGRIYKGNVKITRDDIPWLRGVVENTIKGVAQSQERNRT